MLNFNKETSHEQPCWHDINTVSGLPNITDPEIVEIDRISNISYEEFFKNYIQANKPCIISSAVTVNWRSRIEWVTSNGQPNLTFLDRKFGSSIVPVSDCNIREYNSQHKEDMVFKDYLSYWEMLKQTGDDSQCLYLKDWHFQRHYPNYVAYETPEYFSSDWLNEFCETQKDDFKFVYMGPKGTWTPLHADVYGSYSWSANVCGKKRWLLFPPGQEKQLLDEKKQILYSVNDSDLMKYSVTYVDIIQDAGEIIFVPSGWYHQVWNIEDTISINHNWFNACNIHYIWHCLHNSCLDVEREIADCKSDDDWEDQCQIVLKELHGINYENFLRIIMHIFEARSKYMNSLNKEDGFNKWIYLYDINAIKSVCAKIILCKPSEKVSQIVKRLEDSVNEFLSSVV